MGRPTLSRYENIWTLRRRCKRMAMLNLYFQFIFDSALQHGRKDCRLNYHRRAGQRSFGAIKSSLDSARQEPRGENNSGWKSTDTCNVDVFCDVYRTTNRQWVKNHHLCRTQKSETRHTQSQETLQDLRIQSILLIDAKNGFNSLNGHSVRYVRRRQKPTIAKKYNTRR